MAVPQNYRLFHKRVLAQCDGSFWHFFSLNNYEHRRWGGGVVSPQKLSYETALSAFSRFYSNETLNFLSNLLAVLLKNNYFCQKITQALKLFFFLPLQIWYILLKYIRSGLPIKFYKFSNTFFFIYKMGFCTLSHAFIQRIYFVMQSTALSGLVSLIFFNH